MATCPECDEEVDVDEFDVEKGDLVSCQDCGSSLVVASVEPVELELADDEDEDDDEEEPVVVDEALVDDDTVEEDDEEEEDWDE
jgi:alpha-aminoadipate carrier protein LysW